MTIDEVNRILAEADLLATQDEVQRAIGRMATEITERLHDRRPLVLCVMNGGLIIAGQILPKLGFPLEIDYVHATRYGDKTSGSGLIWRVMPNEDMRGRTVLLLDDILDEGVTLDALAATAASRGRARCCWRCWWRSCTCARCVPACGPISPAWTWGTASSSATAWTTRDTGVTRRGSTR